MAEPVMRRQVLRAAAGAGVWLGGLRVTDLLRPAPAHAFAGVPPRTTIAPSSEDDLAYLTIAEAATLIASRSVSPIELVEACLGRIERHDPLIKAWVSVVREQALGEARAAADEIARSGPRSPLHGIPLGIKDLYDVKGLPTKAGSNVRADAPPAARDATAIARFRRAGAIVIGKTNAHEFAYGTWTPPTCNPWDASRIPGGSSGGSGAALTAGMCLGATGSDTGGSIREPASLCNTVGIKPTFGRVSKAGLLPLAWSLDHAGPMARSVEDCAILLNAMAGADQADPTTANAPVPDFTSALGAGAAGRTIGVPTSVFFDGADPQTKVLVEAAIPVLESLGATVVPLDMPSTQRAASSSYVVIQLSEPLAAHEHYLRRRPQDYQHQTQALLALGAPWSAQHYLRAQRIRTMNVREWVEIFGRVDAVLSPTTPRPAPAKEESAATGTYDLANYTAFFDLNGCPSISVPAGFTSEGLPVGLMLSGAPFDEVRLFGIAHAYEQATGFNRHRPPLEAD